jgi:hypothetical protein
MKRFAVVSAVALIGLGALSPTDAEARSRRHHNNNAGAAVAAGVAGALIGGLVASAANNAYAAPAYGGPYDGYGYDYGYGPAPVAAYPYGYYRRPPAVRTYNYYAPAPAYRARPVVRAYPAPYQRYGYAPVRPYGTYGYGYGYGPVPEGYPGSPDHQELDRR